jgi:hypothetical protein
MSAGPSGDRAEESQPLGTELTGWKYKTHGPPGLPWSYPGWTPPLQHLGLWAQVKGACVATSRGVPHAESWATFTDWTWFCFHQHFLKAPPMFL